MKLPISSEVGSFFALTVHPRELGEAPASLPLVRFKGLNPCRGSRYNHALEHPLERLPARREEHSMTVHKEKSERKAKRKALIDKDKILILLYIVRAIAWLTRFLMELS